MGGPGSGSGYRERCKRTVEECFSLDVNALVRRGVFEQGAESGRLVTEGPGQGYDYAIERRYGGVLHFTLRWRVLRGTEIRVIEDHLPLEKTAVHFGGVRWWFNCPLCHRRCGTIHRPPGNYRFACRRCHRLNYRSQQEGPAWRAMRRREALERGLRFDDNGNWSYTRPKGMHRRTFERIMKQARSADGGVGRVLPSWA